MKVIDLSDIREGQFVEELNQRISEAAQTAHAAHDKVTITVKITVEPTQIGKEGAKADAVYLNDVITISTPKPAPGRTSFFLHPSETGPTLSRKHPDQLGMFEKKPAVVSKIRD